MKDLTPDQMRLLEDWQGLTETTPSDEDDTVEEMKEWKARAATLIGWLLGERSITK